MNLINKSNIQFSDNEDDEDNQVIETIIDTSQINNTCADLLDKDILDGQVDYTSPPILNVVDHNQNVNNIDFMPNAMIG